MKEIKLYRSGKRPLAFRGSEIASASTKDHNSTRWTNTSVYESESGKIVVGISYLSCWQGERDRHTAKVFSTKEEAVTHLEEVCPPKIVEDISDSLGVTETV